MDAMNAILNISRALYDAQSTLNEDAVQFGADPNLKVTAAAYGHIAARLLKLVGNDLDDLTSFQDTKTITEALLK